VLVMLEVLICVNGVGGVCVNICDPIDALKHLKT